MNNTKIWSFIGSLPNTAPCIATGCTLDAYIQYMHNEAMELPQHLKFIHHKLEKLEDKQTNTSNITFSQKIYQQSERRTSNQNKNIQCQYT